ncbi:hypothetical protein HY385_02090 [Candidatus Daviesbacteria bacterium]|nr:hypothetical protein [Candidatus Daviesbacteria bacterium]
MPDIEGGKRFSIPTYHLYSPRKLLEQNGYVFYFQPHNLIKSLQSRTADGLKIITTGPAEGLRGLEGVFIYDPKRVAVEIESVDDGVQREATITLMEQAGWAIIPHSAPDRVVGYKEKI